jgi:hypothetical protein
MSVTNSGTTCSETHGTTSPVSGSAPSGATDGQPLRDLDAITVVVSVAETRTLSGAGTLQCYLYDPSIARWARVPSLDLSVSTASVRDLAFPAMSVIGARNGRVKWVPASVTFSAGSAGVTVTQLGFSSSFRGTYA